MKKKNSVDDLFHPPFLYHQNFLSLLQKKTYEIYTKVKKMNENIPVTL